MLPPRRHTVASSLPRIGLSLSEAPPSCPSLGIWPLGSKTPADSNRSRCSSRQQQKPPPLAVATKAAAQNSRLQSLHGTPAQWQQQAAVGSSSTRHILRRLHACPPTHPPPVVAHSPLLLHLLQQTQPLVQAVSTVGLLSPQTHRHTRWRLMPCRHKCLNPMHHMPALLRHTQSHSSKIQAHQSALGQTAAQCDTPPLTVLAEAAAGLLHNPLFSMCIATPGGI